MINRLFLLLLLFPLLSQAQESAIPDIDYPEARILKKQVFHQNSLWGYMNGGADLYLEYGFEELKVMELIIDSVTVKIEIFRMENPLMARGIYSVKAGGLNHINKNSPRASNPYQVQRAVGPFYISIVNYNGSKKSQDACTKIDFVTYHEIKSALDKVGEKEKESAFAKASADKESPGQWYFFHGPLGASNCSQELEDLLKDYSGYQCWMIKAREGNPNKAYLKLKEEQESKLLQDLEKLSQFSFRKDLDSIIISWESSYKGGGFW